jgi:hypothetical protein
MISTQAVKVKHLLKEVECAKLVIDNLVRENYELKELLEANAKYTNDQSRAAHKSQFS